MSKGPSLKVRLILYPFLAVIFGFVSYILTLNALGYNVYFRDGHIIKEKTGTIILASRPGDAKVTLDGDVQPNRTPGLPFMSLQIKRLRAGEHNIIVEKEGYETWSGSFKIKPGMVSWGTQMLLIPLEKKYQAYNLPLAPKNVLRSQDRTHLLLSLLDSENLTEAFWEVNLTNKENQKLFEVELATGENLTPISFATSNNRALFERNLNDTKSIIVYQLSKNPDNWNISESFKLSFDKYFFNPRDHNELFVIREGSLYTLNYIDKKMSAVIETNVVDAFIDNDSVYYIKKTGDKSTLFRYVSENNIVKIIDQLPVSKTYKIKYNGNGNGYTVLVVDSRELLIYKSSNDPYQIPQRVAQNVDWILPSPKQQFIGYFSNGSFYSYEVEKDETYLTLKDITPDSIDWLPDQFNLVYNKDTKVNFTTYFGYYNIPLFESEKGLPAYISPDSPRLYFFTKNNDTNKVDLFVSELYSG